MSRECISFTLVLLFLTIIVSPPEAPVVIPKGKKGKGKSVAEVIPDSEDSATSGDGNDEAAEAAELA